jgi:hypothetical protein
VSKDDSNRANEPPDPDERPAFHHQQWLVGVVVIFGVAALVAGFYNRIWWLIGFPYILTVLVYTWVRFFR